MGSIAATRGIKDVVNTIYDVKRLIGRYFDDPEVTRDRELRTFNLVCSDDNKPLI